MIFPPAVPLQRVRMSGEVVAGIQVAVSNVFKEVPMEAI